MSIARKILMGSSGGKKSTYVDDVFSTYLYKGSSVNVSGPGQTITNGVDLAGEGGLVWLKSRTATNEHALSDTVNGAGKRLMSQSAGALATGTESVSGFTSSGFTLPGGWNPMVNAVQQFYTSWTFRKAPGFFDIVTYTGDGSSSGRQIAHSLGSVPGCIMVKCTSATNNWAIYHRGTDPSNPENYGLNLNNANARVDNEYYWNDTKPTSTHFTIRNNANVNDNGQTYVAYIFAGGPSTAATAKSVQFNQNYIKSGSTSDYTMGTGDFTVECWWKPNELGNYGIFQISDNTNGLTTSNYENTIAVANNGSNWMTYGANGVNSSPTNVPTVGVWYHVAYVKTGGSHTLYINGIPEVSVTDSTNYYGTTVAIGGYYSTGYLARAEISNFRITKGQALYTSSFIPSTAPLTTTSQGATASNVKLLCCNDTSVTGSTVTSATISVGSGSPTASTSSPFDDLEGFKFGEEEDQSIIKCGYYKTNSSEYAGPDFGWEPQWILSKRIDGGTNNWMIYDSMRGLASAGDVIMETNTSSALLEANDSDAETNYRAQGIYPTGFVQDAFGANREYIYIAIRRPDPLVGKPVEAGTDAFNIVYGNSSSESSPIPNFPSNFPVDVGIYKEPSNTYDWYLHTRQTRGYGVRTNLNNTQGGDDTDAKFDSNAGWGKFGYNTDKASWMWKRHAGFDLVCYKGRAGGSNLPYSYSHNLGRSPEMIWIKSRTHSGNNGDWMVGHKDLYGGSSPWNGYLVLNKTQGQYNDNHPFNNYTPTAIDFRLNNWDRVNENNNRYIAMLFASVDGISKVGSYTGTGAGNISETTGFSPRFLFVKRIDAAGSWYVVDTVRGWSSGVDETLYFNQNVAQTSGTTWTNTNATGFTIEETWAGINANGGKYIYYAHA